MKSSALFVVTGDPRISGTVAEAIRIAAGVGAWKKVQVALYLHGPAVLALSEFPDELVDEDHFTRYLPLVGEAGRPIFVEKDSSLLDQLGVPSQPFQAISVAELRQLAAEHRYLLRF
jgi:hypothetical protein